MTTITKDKLPSHPGCEHEIKVRRQGQPGFIRFCGEITAVTCEVRRASEFSIELKAQQPEGILVGRQKLCPSHQNSLREKGFKVTPCSAIAAEKS